MCLLKASGAVDTARLGDLVFANGQPKMGAKEIQTTDCALCTDAEAKFILDNGVCAHQIAFRRAAVVRTMRVFALRRTFPEVQLVERFMKMSRGRIP